MAKRLNHCREISLIERRDRLMEASPEFRSWWNLHEVSEGYSGRKELNHPLVGSLILQSTTLLVATDPNLKLFIYTTLPEADSAWKRAEFGRVWQSKRSGNLFRNSMPSR